MGAEDAADRAQTLVDAIGLHDRGHHYPSQLSGGEQQRVAIARAFANSPRLLLADEPTGNLDSRTGAHVFDLLINLNRERKTTLVLVTHEAALAARADRVITLSEGRLVTAAAPITADSRQRNGAGLGAPASEASEGGPRGSARQAKASGRYSPRQQ